MGPFKLVDIENPSPRYATTWPRVFVGLVHEVSMSDRKVIIFETRDVNAEERLIREYVVPAFRRLEGREEIRWLMFNRYGADPSVDGGEVTFSLFGDVELVAAEEMERWDALVADGVADEWWVDDTDVRIADFDDRELLHHRIRAAASRMSVEVFEEFDDLPAAIDEFDGDETFGIGWWMGLHYHINQLGYQANDGEEEIDLVFENLRNRLYALTVSVGVSRTEAKIDELIDELESLLPDIHHFRDEHGEHEHRYADRESFEEG